MTRLVVRALAWLSLIAIVVVTIVPIGLRPHDVLPVDADRALAFAVMAAFFVLAYPRHAALCVLLLLAGAGAIELLQYVTPTRDPRLADAVVKAAGVSLGALAAISVNRLRRTRYERSAESIGSQPRSRSEETTQGGR